MEKFDGAKATATRSAVRSLEYPDRAHEIKPVYQNEPLNTIEGLKLVQYLTRDRNQIPVRLDRITGSYCEYNIKIVKINAPDLNSGNRSSAKKGKINFRRLMDEKPAKTRAFVNDHEIPGEQARLLYWTVIGPLGQRNLDKKIDSKSIPGGLKREAILNFLLERDKTENIHKSSEGTIFPRLGDIPSNTEAELRPRPDKKQKRFNALIVSKKIKQRGNPSVRLLVPNGETIDYGGGTRAFPFSDMKKLFLNLLIDKPSGAFLEYKPRQPEPNLKILDNLVTPEFQEEANKYIKNHKINMELTITKINTGENKGMVDMLIRGKSFFGLDVEELYRVGLDKTIDKVNLSLFFVKKGNIDQLINVGLVKPWSNAFYVVRKVVESANGKKIKIKHIHAKDPLKREPIHGVYKVKKIEPERRLETPPSEYFQSASVTPEPEQKYKDVRVAEPNLGILKELVTPKFQEKVNEFLKTHGIDMKLTITEIDTGANQGVVEIRVRGKSFYGLEIGEELYKVGLDNGISETSLSLFFVEKGSSPSKIDKLTLVTLVKPDNSALDVAKRVIKSAYGREIVSFSDKDT